MKYFFKFRLQFADKYRLVRVLTKETPDKLIPLIVRQAHHEWNQSFAVRTEPFDKLRGALSKDLCKVSLNIGAF
jgi:hypothetical protein